MSLSKDSAPPLGFSGRMARLFIDSRLTPIIIISSILLGMMAVILLPREEEPQIKVPMVDIMSAMPGATAAEVENRVTRPMEKLLWEIPGVEYIYSIINPGSNLTIVRFKVGEDLETSLVKLNQKLQTNFDRIPHGVSFPLIKPRTIDDVPILALTLHSKSIDHYQLRRLAAQLDDNIKTIPDVSETTLIGGARRQMRILLDPLLLASRNLTSASIVSILRQSNSQIHTGSQSFLNQEIILQTGNFLQNIDEIGDIVVGVSNHRPIYLRDVSTLIDGAEEPSQYVFFGSNGQDEEEAAVTLSIAKRPGANAIDVVKQVLAKTENLKGVLIPGNVTVTTTRDYGQTSSEKSNELLLHMGIAVFGVSILILLFLGWRESFVVLFAIPTTLALTLFVFYLYGYTLNRITLFALIFSIGILVDDAIVVVENIVRHLKISKGKRESFRDIAVHAVDEVGNPTILATWAVIAAVLPMAFVSGMMGPYMRPIPIGSSAAMLFSLVIAFSVTPWAALRILKRHKGEDGEIQPDDSAPPNLFTRFYFRVMYPLLRNHLFRWSFLALIVLVLCGSMSLVGLRAVKVKMLPFDNKSELQVILNMSEGSTLEETARVTHELAKSIYREPEVRDYQTYIGTASPFNFNGLVRHYFLRRGANMADIQINLLPKHDRKAQSHEIAKRIRPRLTEIASRYGGTIAVAEVPPGPPVLQTLVAEIYGPDETSRLSLANEVKKVFHSIPGVVDIDSYLEEQQPKIVFHVDKEKAALHGISEATVAQTIQLAVKGASIDLMHLPSEREDVNILLELPRDLRARPDDLLSLQVRSETNPHAQLIPLREIVTIEHTQSERSIYHKNLKPVTYVTADVAGVIESPIYAILAMNKKLKQLKGQDFGGTESRINIFNSTLPFDNYQPSIKWDGEWQVTIEVFRDLGLSFLAVLILIYMLMVGWFKNYITPLIVMTVIPFSLIGILPAHWAMGAFFTATSMIGFMAGAGIVVRNSIILVDFIELRISQGLPLEQAVVESGAVRFRPMMLTAFAVAIGALVILADPIFQGLAISLLFGAIASLAISPLVVPLLYYLIHKKRPH
jgi:multidrug efflux pump subunit AcrB